MRLFSNASPEVTAHPVILLTKKGHVLGRHRGLIHIPWANAAVWGCPFRNRCMSRQWTLRRIQSHLPGARTVFTDADSERHQFD